MTYGLVLGGGGVVGIAWERGVLDALDLPRPAVVVGTSAGALVGAAMLLGIGDPTLGSGAATAPPRDPAAALRVFELWRTAGDMTAALARQIADEAAAASGVDPAAWVASFTERIGTAWPDAPLFVVATDGATGKRVVWSASSGVPLDRAVAASCAVPGLFPPVEIDGSRYMDGNVWSSGSVDVLLSSGVAVEKAVFVGPLVGNEGIALLGSRALDREVAAVRAAGVDVLTITPGERYAAAGFSLMDASRRAEAYDVGKAEGEDVKRTSASLP